MPNQCIRIVHYIRLDASPCCGSHRLLRRSAFETMKNIFVILLLLILINNAQGADMSDLDDVANVLTEVTGVDVRGYATRDFGRDKFAEARSVFIEAGPYSFYTEQAKYRGYLQKVRSKLPNGYVAFIGTTNNLASDGKEGIEIVVGTGENQLEILNIAATDAVNYNMLTKDLIDKLKIWDSKYGIDIWHAETDKIELELLNIPKDVKSFAEEVYKFCPDIVNQGTGSVASLESEIRESKSLHLWWD